MDRADKGKALIEQMFGPQKANSGPALADMGEITSDYLFGEIWSRDGLALRDQGLQP